MIYWIQRKLPRICHNSLNTHSGGHFWILFSKFVAGPVLHSHYFAGEDVSITMEGLFLAWPLCKLVLQRTSVQAQRTCRSTDTQRISTSQQRSWVPQLQGDPNLGQLNPDLGQLNPDLSQLNPDLSQLNPDLSQLNLDLSQLNPNLSQLYPNL